MNRKQQDQTNAHLYIYEVSGLTEWAALIRIGKARIRVNFTGGTITGFGSTPARYCTCSPGIAAIIEQSEYFKTGKITRRQ